MGHENLKAFIAFTLVVLVFVTVLQADEWNADPGSQETIHGIAEALFDTYVVPLIVLSILLTGALLGALYLGMKPENDEGGDEA